MSCYPTSMSSTTCMLVISGHCFLSAGSQYNPAVVKPHNQMVMGMLMRYWRACFPGTYMKSVHLKILADRIQAQTFL